MFERQLAFAIGMTVIFIMWGASCYLWGRNTKKKPVELPFPPPKEETKSAEEKVKKKDEDKVNSDFVYQCLGGMVNVIDDGKSLRAEISDYGHSRFDEKSSIKELLDFFKTVNDVFEVKIIYNLNGGPVSHTHTQLAYKCFVTEILIKIEDLCNKVVL